MKDKHQKIWEIAKPLLKEGLRKDYILHTKGVIQAMELLIDQEGGIEDILIPAAILHDVGWSKVPADVQYDLRYENNIEVGERMHLEAVPDLVTSILGMVDYPKTKTKKIIKIIQGHKSSNPETNEEKLLIDADQLADVFRKQFYSDSICYHSTPEEHYYYRKEHCFFYTNAARKIYNIEMEKRVYEFKKDVIMHDILLKKPIKKIAEKYIKYDQKKFSQFRIPDITVHGRFQPPLHFNHFYAYLALAFRIAHKVKILIVDPLTDDKDRAIDTHSAPLENNLFNYEERIEIFREVLSNFCIPMERYEFVAFDISDHKSWAKVLDKNIPNLINTYSPWGGVKLKRFLNAGYSVIHSSIPQLIPVSQAAILGIINSEISNKRKKEQLVKAGYMEEAIPTLFEILERRNKQSGKK